MKEGYKTAKEKHEREIWSKDVFNEPMLEDIRKIKSLTQHGCKSIDLIMRVDGKDYGFEADWLKDLLKVLPPVPEGEK